MPADRSRKPQQRTGATRERLLSAAEQVFARHGYESAQLAEIAAASGFSKGALYAHFKSKEDLFLALARKKAAAYQSQLRAALASASDHQARIVAFRSFYAELAGEKSWALIILEAKLFLSRHPETAQRLRQAEEEVEDSVEKELVALFGDSAKPAAKALGGICSALVLEAGLDPAVLTDQRINIMLAAIFDTLLGLPLPSSGTDSDLPSDSRRDRP